MHHVVGNGGGPYRTQDGAVNTHLADVHRIPANDYAYLLGATVQLAAPAAAGDTQLQLTSNVAFPVGTYVHMGSVLTVQEPVHLQVTVQVGDGVTVTLDRPLDYGYDSGDDVTVSVVNLAAASIGATLANPISLKYRPHAGQVEHIERLLFSMTHATAGADDLFGGGVALPNGVVVRAHVAGVTKTYTIWKNNGDITNDMYDVRYTDKAGSGNFGTNGRGSFNRIGVVIPQDPARGDYTEFLLQDPLPVISCKIKLQGHIEGG